MSSQTRFAGRILRLAWLVSLVAAAVGYVATGELPVARFGLASFGGVVPALASPGSGTNAAPAAGGGGGLLTDADFLRTLARVNTARSQAIDAAGLESLSTADWLTTARRVSLALVGSGLSIQEIRRLEQLPESERVATHLESLLRDHRFHDYWSERWTRLLVGNDGGPFLVFRRRRFRMWIAEQLAADRPYDAWVTDLITAQGLWTDRPAVNFLTSTYDTGDGAPDPVRLAARTSRVFLGLRIDCLQCHDDFLGNVSLGDPGDRHDGQQSDFHSLAAFFSAAKNNGLQGIVDAPPDYRYQYLYAEEEVPVTPTVPFARDLLPESGDARDRLAAWVTHPENRQSARAAVNHVWALMLGRPLGAAVDDLPLGGEHSAMLDPLASDFARNGFQLRRLIRLIVASDAFRVSSRSKDATPVTEAHERVFAAFPLVRLRPEQLAAAAAQAARVKTIDRNSAWLVRLQRFGNVNDFVDRFGDANGNEFSHDPATVSQALVMINGKMIDEQTASNPILHAGTHIRMFSPDEAAMARNIFLSVLNRRPGESAEKHFAQRIAAAENPDEAIEDLYWVLINSSEFAWNH